MGPRGLASAEAPVGHRLAALGVVALCLLAAALTWWLLEPQAVERFMGETGPVERLTAASYALCALAAWWRSRGTAHAASGIAMAVVLFAFCARELDWHRAFTGTTVLRLSWYASPAPLAAKAVAAAVVLTVAAAGAWLARRYALPLWRDLLGRRQPLTVTVFVFFATLVLSKVLDRSVSILEADFGTTVPLLWKALRTAIEEWLELGLSLLVALGLYQHGRERSPPA